MKSQPECTLLFLLREETILLALKKRGFGKGWWNGVGGKVNNDELITDALIRECQEEIGVTPKMCIKFAELDFNSGTSVNAWGMKVYVFVTTSWEGEPVESEEMRPRWFKYEEIPYNHMWEDDRHWLPQVLAGKKLKGSFTFDDTNKLQSHHITKVMNFEN